MKLRSRLDILLEYDLDSLLAVQDDVTRLIEMQVKQLQRKLAIVNNRDLNGHHSSLDVPILEDDKENLPKDYEEGDTDDFILTQFHHDDKHLKQEHNGLNFVAAPNLYNNPINQDLSSPLKGTQSLPDSLASIENDRETACTKVKDEVKITSGRKHILQTVNAVNNELISNATVSGTKKLCLESAVIMHNDSVCLNKNPITKKPWILEDFKRNEDITSTKRGRKRIDNMKLKKFYTKGGRPPEISIEENIEDIADEQIDCDFENLRERSRSPPGYGRLDFPSTQERFDDKRKAQQIIYNKTKQRFLQATCTKIPPQERAYWFKSDSLNRAVDDGVFDWNESELKIYLRR